MNSTNELLDEVELPFLKTVRDAAVMSYADGPPLSRRFCSLACSFRDSLGGVWKLLVQVPRGGQANPLNPTAGSADSRKLLRHARIVAYLPGIDAGVVPSLLWRKEEAT
jgi:hypothetical protein